MSRAIDYRRGPSVEEREAAKALEREGANALRKLLRGSLVRNTLMAMAGLGLSLLIVYIFASGLVDNIKAFGR